MPSRGHILLVCLVSWAGASAVNESDDRLRYKGRRPFPRSGSAVGGRSVLGGTYQGESPSHATIVFGRHDKCSGTLIDVEWVLTSALCLLEHLDGNFDIALGLQRYMTNTSNSIWVKPGNIYLPPDFNPKSLPTKHNLALIKLTPKITPNDDVLPIDIYETQQKDDEDASTAFGIPVNEIFREALISLTRSPANTRPVYSWVKSVNRCACQLRWHNILMCGRPERSDDGPCEADHGGGVLARPDPQKDAVVVGVISYATGNPNGDFVFTPLPPYMDWIEDTLCRNDTIQLPVPPSYPGSKEVDVPHQIIAPILLPEVTSVPGKDFRDSSRESVMPTSPSNMARPSHWPEVMKPVDIPFDARFRVEDKYCHGSLIASNWVLTAAHCVNDLVNKTFDVYVGASPINGTYVAKGTAENIHVHNWYNATTKPKRNDIALIKLNTAVPPTNGMAYPIRLPDELDAMDLEHCDVKTAPPPFVEEYGLGFTLTLQSEHSGIARASLQHKCECRAGWLASILCARTISNQGLPCRRDDGSGVFGAFPDKPVKLHGVLSENECKGDTNVAFTPVFPYVKWIQSIMSAPK